LPTVEASARDFRPAVVLVEIIDLEAGAGALLELVLGVFRQRQAVARLRQHP